MGTIVMSGPQNVSLDGVIQDPDGKEGFTLGGWFVESGGKDLEEWNKVALVTLASSHRLFLSPPPQLMTSRRLETRRSVFIAGDASTNAASNSPTKGEPRWERSS